MALFSVVTVATHLPPFVTAAVRSGPAHAGQHLLLGILIVVFLPIVRRELGSASTGLDRLGRPRASKFEG